jgi:hypothetical protein
MELELWSVSVVEAVDIFVHVDEVSPGTSMFKAR